ncbi:MAG: protein-disulfide reductase DsbD, partial [Desulfuromonadales bacterium]|nr:protein-disulfide reductase DsbD [Desulfuromonadales bacterium]
TISARLSALRTGLLSLAMTMAASSVGAIGFDEVRDFDEVFRISASADGRDRIVLRWRIEQGYYLYNNRFLSFAAETEGVELGDPIIPPGKI